MYGQGHVRFDTMFMDGMKPLADAVNGESAYRFFTPTDAKAHVLKHPRVVSSWTNGLLQLKKRLFSGGINPEKFDTRAIPLSLYCLSASKNIIRG